MRRDVSSLRETRQAEKEIHPGGKCGKAYQCQLISSPMLLKIQNPGRAM
jgi:hypothetical protein